MLNNYSMKVNGRNLHIERYGSQDHPLVILLHHGLGSTYSWRTLIPKLVAAGWQCLAYDRWGYGMSDLRPGLSVPNFPDDIADLECLQSALGCDQVSLIGHSDGGTIALYYAALNPKRVSSLITVAAHIYIEPKMEAGLESIVNSYLRDHRFRKGLQRLHGDKTDSVFYNWYNGWRQPENHTWEMRPLLLDIVCPALVIQGTHDEHATPQHACAIAAAIPGAQLWLVPDARHLIPQELSEEFNQHVIEFLESTLEREARSL